VLNKSANPAVVARIVDFIVQAALCWFAEDILARRSHYTLPAVSFLVVQ